jgi:hypothetical protein
MLEATDMARTAVWHDIRYRFDPQGLLVILRDNGNDFQRRTYTALQHGIATEHQQRAAASGIVLQYANKAESADTIEVLVAEILRLTEAVAFAHGEGCEWPDDPLPLGCIARRLMDEFELASADTHPKDGDVEQAPLVSGAVPKADAPKGAA